ncbi:MAG: DinB family protein [Pirellulales bacterium]
MDRSLIEKYVAGGSQLREAYAGLTKADLFAVPIPNTWSLHQIAIHMMDSDLIGSDRMKRIACMEKPLLIGYDETGFNNLPGIELIDAFEAIELFAKNRVFTGLILTQLPDESFKRYGIHSEKGKVTLEEMVANYIQHLEGHLEWIAKKRRMVCNG